MNLREMNHLSKHFFLVKKCPIVLAILGEKVHERDEEGLLVAAVQDLVENEMGSRFRMLLLLEGNRRVTLDGLCFR